MKKLLPTSHPDYPNQVIILIVSQKNAAVYSDILDRYAVEPSNFLMVGNSLKSDVMPVSEIGGHAIHIPFHTTWSHETVLLSQDQKSNYHELSNISHIPDFLSQ